MATFIELLLALKRALTLTSGASCRDLFCSVDVSLEAVVDASLEAVCISSVHYIYLNLLVGPTSSRLCCNRGQNWSLLPGCSQTRRWSRLNAERTSTTRSPSSTEVCYSVINRWFIFCPLST